MTVGDDSVSRVISLRLEEATELADRPRGARDAAPAGEPAAGVGRGARRGACLTVGPEPGAPVAGDLEAGLARSRGGFMSRLRGLLGGGEIAAADWDEVEEALIAGDVGASLAGRVVEGARTRRDAPSARGRRPGRARRAPRPARPRLGPRGRRSTATRRSSSSSASTGPARRRRSASSPHRETAAGRRVLLAAADTFRAAAIEQLRIWAERARAVEVVAHAPGADPGAVVYDALDAALARGADVVIADTAGRLHTKANLMDELAKIRRVIDRRLPGAVPETLFVLDATTGQNGLAQAVAFHAAVGLTGIVLTKLDSTARGGIVFAIEDQLRVPVRFVGVGEGIEDLLPFDPERLRGRPVRRGRRRRVARRVIGAGRRRAGALAGAISIVLAGCLTDAPPPTARPTPTATPGGHPDDHDLPPRPVGLVRRLRPDLRRGDRDARREGRPGRGRGGDRQSR